MIYRFLLAISLFASLMTAALAFDLQGHRGARGLMPENTLPAFAKALSIGVSTLELDTGVTKDGVVVVSHNPSIHGDLARGADGQWLVSDPLIWKLTFAELQDYDLGRIRPGSRSAEWFPDQQVIDGTRLPSLAQVFELVNKAGNEDVRLNIETKINPNEPEQTIAADLFANALLEVTIKYGMQDRISIQSFDWRTLQAVQKANPSIETVYLTAQQKWLNNVGSEGTSPSKWTAGFNLDDHNGNLPQMIKSAGGKVWSPFHRDLDGTKLMQAHALGLKVIPWTVNDEKTMVALIKMGVDGLISDYPDRLRAVMKAEGLALPKPTPVQP